MKFRFCGGLDPPAWLLTEISVMAKLSNVRTKIVCAQARAEIDRVSLL